MAGGVHGRGHVWQGVCMAGGHVWQGACIAGGHVWQGACIAGDMCGRGASMAGGMHGSWACMTGGGERQPLQWMVRILLECSLIYKRRSQVNGKIT